jgi:hypothetical protein
MKTLTLILTAGIGYATLGELTSQAVNNYSLNGDSKFFLFVMGMVLGVFTARRLNWID